MATAVETSVESMPNEPEANKLFRMVMKYKGSDLHLKVGLAPSMRLAGVLRQMQLPPLSTADMERLMFPLLTPRSGKSSTRKAASTSPTSSSTATGDPVPRQPVQAARPAQPGRPARQQLDPQLRGSRPAGRPGRDRQYDQGIVILAGVTGSGKTTTIASMLQYINERERLHIVTIEDPIEFTFKDDKCIINQREVGIDVIDWDTALKHAVRQDPDIILVGEMRDRETFSAAMHAAETGHLVFGTIHASTAPSTISRILDLFPQDMHSALRQTLAFNLKAIIAQKLLPTTKELAAKGTTRVPTVEIMRMNPTVRKLILNEEDIKLGDAIRIGKEEGMVDFTESLRQLVVAEKIERATAFEVAPSPEALKMALKGITSLNLVFCKSQGSPR